MLCTVCVQYCCCIADLTIAPCIHHTNHAPLYSLSIHRYKKHSAAKDLSTKSLADKKAIFGAAMSYPTSTSTSSSSTSSNTTDDVFSKISMSTRSHDHDHDAEKKEKKSSKKSKKSKRDE